MFNHSSKKRALTLAATTGLLGSFAAVASPPAQGASVCTFEVLSLTAWELQDSNGTDEIRFKLGDDVYGTWTFWDNWQRNDSLGHPDESFLSTVSFTLYEMDGVVRQTIDTDPASCTVGTHTMDLIGKGAIYELEYRITD